MLTKECGKLAIDKNPINCADKLSFPRTVFFGAPGATIVAVGPVPTAAEVQAAIDLGVIMTTGRITNGQKPASEMATLTGADTEDGLDKVVREVESITGSIRRLNVAFLQALQQNNLNMNQRFQIWYVDDNGYFMGGTKGFLGSLYFPAINHGGQGQDAQVPLSVKWVRNHMEAMVYNEVPDIAYLDLTNFSPAAALLAINAMAVANNASTLTVLLLKQAGAKEVVTAKLPGYQTAIAAASSIATLTVLQGIVDTVNIS